MEEQVMTEITLTNHEKATLATYARQLAEKGRSMPEASTLAGSADKIDGFSNEALHKKMAQLEERLEISLKKEQRVQNTILAALERIERVLSQHEGELSKTEQMLISNDEKAERHAAELKNAAVEVIQQSSNDMKVLIERVERLING